jgi:predicted dehydrogenase
VESALATIDAGAVVLANPPMGRESQVRAAGELGLPLLIEKPIALSMEEAASLVKLADSYDIPLMVGLNFRYLGVTKATMQLIAEDTVGKPQFGRFTYERYRDGNRPDLNKYPLTMDQPMLWEQSIHHFDLMRFVYQAEPVRIYAHTWNPPWSMYESDANVAALILFDNGINVNYQGTWQSNWQQPHFEWRTECEKGVIAQHEQFGDLAYALRDDETATTLPLPPHERWLTETIGLLDAFLDTVLDGKTLQCSGSDHLRSLAMLEACIISSREARAVEIESILQRVT